MPPAESLERVHQEIDRRSDLGPILGKKPLLHLCAPIVSVTLR